ncbi:hypothetical protein ACHAXT_013236 [Thalassiosira profunda]
MDEELPDTDALARPLLNKDGPPGDSATTAPMTSNASLRSTGDGGEGGERNGASGLEQGDDPSASPPRRQIPTLVFILVPLVAVFVGTFLAAAFMPPSTDSGEEGPAPAPSPEGGTNSSGTSGQPPESKLHDDPVAPSLLFVRDSDGLVNVRENELYRRLKFATFHEDDSDSVILGDGEMGPALVLQSDKSEVGYGEPLRLEWNRLDEAAGVVGDEDILAMYCPAGETDPKKFREAATLAQVRATHRYHSQTQRGEDENAWHIPSFPIVREETCEFRVYARSITEGEGKDEYTLRASTGPISLTSNQSPTGIHLSLTGNPSEIAIQFATGDSGTPLVEVAKKADIHSALRMANHVHTAELRDLAQVTDVSWTKYKGVSTSYAATDMCQEPATSTDPGWFASPGHLHTVLAKDLEPDTEYAYRVGLSFGQGIKWSDYYYVFRSSSATGVGSSTPGEPAVTFVAFGDQGCADSASHSHGDNVTRLITNMMQERTIHSVHQIGDLSYADGAAHVWDVWHAMIEAYAARLPVMVGVGNHEYDHTESSDSSKDPSGVNTTFGFQPEWGKGDNGEKGAFKSEGGECGVPVSKRFAVPDNGNGVFWYSYDQSLVHVVVLSTEHDMADGSPQHTWLEKDLAAVNRTVTPWIVVEMHRPLYHSEVLPGDEWQEQTILAAMQSEIEDLLYAFSVDLVISGHVHSYFRSCDGLYSYKCGNGGPTFVTVGTGGASLNGKSSVIVENDYTAAFDKEHFGVGRVSVMNATALRWEFVAVGGDVLDEAWLTRERR